MSPGSGAPDRHPRSCRRSGRAVGGRVSPAGSARSRGGILLSEGGTPCSCEVHDERVRRPRDAWGTQPSPTCRSMSHRPGAQNVVPDRSVVRRAAAADGPGGRGSHRRTGRPTTLRCRATGRCAGCRPTGPTGEVPQLPRAPPGRGWAWSTITRRLSVALNRGPLSASPQSRRHPRTSRPPGSDPSRSPHTPSPPL